VKVISAVSNLTVVILEYLEDLRWLDVSNFLLTNEQEVVGVGRVLLINET